VEVIKRRAEAGSEKKEIEVTSPDGTISRLVWPNEPGQTFRHQRQMNVDRCRRRLSRERNCHDTLPPHIQTAFSPHHISFATHHRRMEVSCRRVEETTVDRGDDDVSRIGVGGGFNVNGKEG